MNYRSFLKIQAAALAAMIFSLLPSTLQAQLADLTDTIRVSYVDGETAPDFGVEYDYYKTNTQLVFLDSPGAPFINAYTWDITTGRLTDFTFDEFFDYSYTDASSGTYVRDNGDTGSFVTYDAAWDLDFDGTPDGEQIEAGFLPNYSHKQLGLATTDTSSFWVSNEGVSADDLSLTFSAQQIDVIASGNSPWGIVNALWVANNGEINSLTWDNDWRVDVTMLNSATVTDGGTIVVDGETEAVNQAVMWLGLRTTGVGTDDLVEIALQDHNGVKRIVVESDLAVSDIGVAYSPVEEVHIRLSYNSNAAELTTAYSYDGNQYVTLANFSVDSLPSFNNRDPLAIALGAESDNVEISSGENTFKNFSVVSDREDLFNNAHFLNDQEVTIPFNFSPFGNTLEQSKFSDDGSAALVDLSGVIIWRTADGTSRRLADTELAVPLYVTNSEILVWDNRYTPEFLTYEGRPTVELTLYRTNAAGEIFSTSVDLAGKEVLGSPEISTSTGSLTIATSEALDGGDVSFTNNGITFTVPDADQLLVKFYRVTFSGIAQLLETFTGDIPSNAFQTSGPDVQALGFGSDGSAFYRYTSAEVIGVFDVILGTFEVVEELSEKFIWVNSLGEITEVTLPNGVAKVVSVTENRLLLEETPGAGLSDFRIDLFTRELSGPTPVAVNGSVLSASTYTKVGDDKFFYTIEQDANGGLLLNGQTATSYDGAVGNGTFTGGTGYADGDAITLSDGSIVTVDSASVVVPIDAQTHLDYDGAIGNGTFNDGLDYADNDVITLSDGSVVTVNFVDINGAIIDFTLDTSNSTGASAGGTLIQDAVLPDVGTGFTLTLDTNNVGGGEVEDFSVDSTGSSQLLSAGDTLTEVPLGGGFSLTVGLNNLAIASTINTFRLSAGTAVLERSTQAPIFVSVNAQISKSNPLDGSAILEDVDQESLIWLHDQGDNFVLIPDSDQATALFVTADECVLWTNEGAPIPEGGVPEDALVVHEELTGGGTTTNRTELNDPVGVGNVEGTYVLNSQPYTPSTAFWFLNTAEKLAPDTALLRTYRLLDTAPAADADSDGLPDSVETGSGTFVSIDTDTGTDPNNPDTDGDGLLDRYETGTGIFVTSTETGTNPNMPDTDGDGFLDGVETNTGLYLFYDFGDGDLAADGDNQDDLRNNTGTDPNLAGDFDEDGTLDGLDNDIDDDTVLNSLDAFPFDPVEDTDTDGDGIGNNADTDDDNDGVEDVDDAFPLDPTRSTYDLRLSASAQTSSADAQTREIRVSSNTSWVWVSSDPTWLSAGGESVGQNGSQTFEYQITQNIDDEPRSAELTFTTTTGDVQVTISVSQLGGPGAEGLAITPNTLSVGQDATTRQVQIITQRDWRWESGVSWITSAEAVNQSGTQTFSFAVEANDTGLSRDGTFTITTIEGDLSATVLVSQSFTEDDDRDGLSNDEETKPYFLITGQFTWEQARLDAQRRGGTLAAVTTALELADMQDVLEAFDNNVWIGGSDEASLGVFEWVTSEPFADSNWAAGQPDSLFGVSGISLQPNFEWDDLSKYTKLNGYILELPATEPLDPYTLDPTNRVKDGELWVDNDNDGLLGIDEVAIGTDPNTADTDQDGLSDGEEVNPFEVIAGAFTWEGARDDAQGNDVLELGRNLAVIDSEAVLIQVMKVTAGSLENALWIGASDLMGIGNFEWVTDPVTPLVYANWAEFQPNSFLGATAIKLQTDFEWDDRNSTDLRGYLLERDSTIALNPDSDGDNLLDGLEVKFYGTNPNEDDTDGDELSDGNEVVLGANPLVSDTDGDGLDDGQEDANNNGVIDPDVGETDPTNPDTDGDGISDGDEVTNGSNPNDSDDPNVGGDADPDHYNPEFLREQEVSIPDGFSPFGNSFEVTKYGDDGSSVIKDNSGVLIWADSRGVFREVPESDFSLALKVTNNELIVWKNRYVPFDNYDSRPPADVVIYRLDAQGNITGGDERLATQGKNIIGSPVLTTATDDFVIATSEVLEGQLIEQVVGNTLVYQGYIDSLIIRYYRVTASGELQFLSQYADEIERNPVLTEWDRILNGSDLEALGFGSDGASLLRYTRSVNVIPRITETTYLWANGKGEIQQVPLEALSRTVSVSDRRLVVEAGQGGGLVDFRRFINTGQVIGPFNLPIQGAVLDFENLTRVGYSKFFYTLEDSTVHTYRLSGANVTLVRSATLTNLISAAARVGVSNPLDGSAIVGEEDLGFSLWLHDEGSSGGGDFTEISSSAFAKALYVTNTECVLWENAFRPIQSNGLPEPAVVVHHELNGDASDLDVVDGTIRRPISFIRGDYVIDAPPFTPDFDNWFVNTSEKIDAATTIIRSYRLRSELKQDQDNDGLTGPEELALGTDPFNPDSDGDGLSDGDEVYPYYLVDGPLSYSQAVVDAERRAASNGNVYGHLVVITSQTEMNAVQRRFGDLLPAASWIGLDDLGVEGDFQWVDTSPLNPLFNGTPGAAESFDFANWATAQPDNLNDADAVAMERTYVWRTQQAGELRSYILELQPTNPLVADTDGDGLSDGDEVLNTMTDPNNQDTDGDDGAVINYIVDGQLLGTATLNGNDAEDPAPLDNSNPAFTDQDGDGLTDAVELLITGTLVDNPDSDGDGLTDGVETNTGNFVDKTNTGTDPNNSDSDGDGVGDGDELFNGTDPNKDSYVIANPRKPAGGHYSGLLLRNSDGRSEGLMAIKVSIVDGLYLFSGSLKRFNQATVSFTGEFDSFGVNIPEQFNSGGQISPPNMAFDRVNGLPLIGGVFDDKRFNLSKAAYRLNTDTNLTRETAAILKRRYTYLLPSNTTESLSVPAGDGIGYGKINNVGASKILGWSNAGYRYTYNGRLQHRNADGNTGTLPFYAQANLKNNGSEWIAGTIRYEVPNVANQDIEGRLRYLKPVNNVKYYPAGFDEDISMMGAMYRTGGRYADIQADGFSPFANNARGVFEGSLANGSEFNSYVFTWETDGDMIAPLNFTYYKGAKYRRGAGFYTGSYIDEIIGQRCAVRGVVFQNVVADEPDLFFGHAANARFGLTVQHSIIPNDNGDVAPSASLSPTSKSFDNIGGQSPGGTYPVSIEISPSSVIQNWTVDIPAEYDWVTADVTSGSGSATINITVAGRSTGSTADFFDRTAVIQIGGFNHTIIQEKRTAN